MTLQTKLNQNLKCDNPKCDVVFTWLEDPQNPEESIPEGFWRFLILAVPRSEEKWTFCSKYCLLDFMKTFEPRKSPKEIREENEEKMKQAAKIEALAEKKAWTDSQFFTKFDGEEEETQRMANEGGKV
jgi:hypothetical protein